MIDQGPHGYGPFACYDNVSGKYCTLCEYIRTTYGYLEVEKSFFTSTTPTTYSFWKLKAVNITTNLNQLTHAWDP